MAKPLFEHELIYIDCIDKAKIQKVLEWYNNKEYAFATGIDKSISISELHTKLAEVLVCENEFFLGIYFKCDGELIGLIRGGVNTRFKNALWINSIIIDKEYQNRGFGSIVVNIINSYFRNTHKVLGTYVSVIEDNQKALGFWIKNGFYEVRKMKKKLILNSLKHNVIIMFKKLNEIEA